MSNNLLRIRFDKHMSMAIADEDTVLNTLGDEYFSQLHEETEPSATRGELGHTLIDQSTMEWQSSSPHDAVQKLVTLSEFQPEAGNPKQPAATSSESGPVASSPSRVPAAKELIRGEYRKYTETQVNQLLHDYFVEGKFASEAALDAGIKKRTGQDYVKKAKEILEQERVAALAEPNSDQELQISQPPVQKERKYGRQKLFKEHTHFFLKYYDEHPDATLAMARDAVMAAFPGLTITVSAISKHLIKHCNLTLKKLEKIPMARNDPKTLEKRKEVIMAWDELSDFDYATNCVFIDEAGFNLNIRRTFARSVRGKPAKVKVAAQRGVSITIIGAMCEKGIINLTVRKPTAVASKKKRKVDFQGASVNVNGRVGTRTSHYLQFLNATLDELDKHGMQGRYLIMDNAPIHRSTEVAELITSRGYKCMYLPPYSPFLNPIEEMWSKIKFGVRRDELTDKDLLIPRIQEAAKQVTISDCEGWIRHSMSFFSKCLAIEEML
jgi:hypothetical protein